VIAADLADRVRLLDELELVARDLAQHRDRIEQLFARTLERRERGFGPRERGLGREILELAPRLGDLRAAFEQEHVEVLELDQPRCLALVALVDRFLADRLDLVVGEVRDHAGLGEDATLEVGQVRERRLLIERVHAVRRLDRDPRGTGVVEHRALLLDDRVEALLELAFAARQLVGER